MKRMLLSVLVAIFVTSAAYAVETENQTEPSELQDSLMQLGFRVFAEPVEAPDFTLKDLDGETVSLSSYQGKIVFLNFWATWCPPCRAEMPSMEALYQEFGGEDFEIVAVDLQEPVRTVKKYIEDGGYTYPVLLDTDGRVGGTYGARSIPTTYLIDRNGFAIGYLVGSREWEGPEITAVFRQLIGAAD